METARPRKSRFYVAAIATALTMLGAFWFLSADLRMGYLPSEYASWQGRHALLAGCKLAPTLMLGDSRAAAGLLPSTIGGSTNLALGGGTPLEMYYISEHALKCPGAVQQVIVSISPEQAMNSRFFWERTGLYGVLSFDELEEVRHRSRALSDASVFDRPKFADLDAVIGNALHSVDFPSYDTSYILRHGAVGRLRENTEIMRETLAAHGQHFYGSENGCDDIADDAQLTRFVSSSLLEEYFDRMLDAYKAHDVPVFFTAVPMNDATYRSMQPNVVKGFQAFIDKLAAAHPNFKVVGPAVARLDDRYFGDSTHLNAKGAELFSRNVSLMLAANARGGS